MGVRPPQGGGSDEPDTIEFGIAALDARLAETDLDFPARASEIVAALDDEEIPYDAFGHTLSVREALEQLPRQEFESESELLDLLHPIFEDHRASASVGIVQQVRDLLPF
jgi:hypothetical protein